MSIRREDIIGALETRLKTISVVNGYHTALGSHIFVWLPAVINESERPAANVRDMDDSIVRSSVPYDTHEMSVEIDVASTTVTALRQAIYDVYKAIGTDPTFGGLAIDTALLGDAFEVDQLEKVVTGAVISVTVTFRTSNYQES
jgi:hypothetical protein